MRDVTTSPLTLVHPPETNPHQQTVPPETGVSERIDFSLDPLQLHNQAVEFRHSGWARDRRRVYDALRRTKQTLNRLVDFKECGKHAYVFQSVDDPDVYVIGGSTCHDRFCLPCGRERTRVISTNVLDKLENEQARFLTLTLKSSTETLTELLAKLTQHFTALRRSKLWRNKVTGGVAFLEVVWRESTARWHPHFHCLVQGRYIPKDELSRTWHKITGTSYIVDIRIATNAAHVTHYITKYASKPLDHSVLHDPDKLDEAVVALKGKRLCLTFGTWRGVSLTTPLDSGQWVNLGTLTEIIDHAEQGDYGAAQALDALKIEYAPSTRAPPTPDAPCATGSPPEQYRFTFPLRTTVQAGVSGTH